MESAEPTKELFEKYFDKYEKLRLQRNKAALSWYHRNRDQVLRTEKEKRKNIKMQKKIQKKIHEQKNSYPNIVTTECV